MVNLKKQPVLLLKVNGIKAFFLENALNPMKMFIKVKRKITYHMVKEGYHLEMEIYILVI